MSEEVDHLSGVVQEIFLQLVRQSINFKEVISLQVSDRVLGQEEGVLAHQH